MHVLNSLQHSILATSTINNRKYKYQPPCTECRGLYIEKVDPYHKRLTEVLNPAYFINTKGGRLQKLKLTKLVAICSFFLEPAQVDLHF